MARQLTKYRFWIYREGPGLQQLWQIKKISFPRHYNFLTQSMEFISLKYALVERPALEKSYLNKNFVD
jgi:hypothetical protein